jgi:hypothetical protein
MSPNSDPKNVEKLFLHIANSKILLCQVAKHTFPMLHCWASRLKASRLKASLLKASLLKASRLKASLLKASLLKASLLKESQLKASLLKASRLNASQIRAETPRSVRITVTKLHYEELYDALLRPTYTYISTYILRGASVGYRSDNIQTKIPIFRPRVPPPFEAFSTRYCVEMWGSLFRRPPKTRLKPTPVKKGLWKLFVSNSVYQTAGLKPIRLIHI